MTTPGFHTSGPVSGPPPRRGKSLRWAFAAAAALGLAAALSQCEGKPPPPAQPAAQPEPPPLAPWEVATNEIHVTFDSNGRFSGAAGQNILHASRAALEKCLRGKHEKTQCFKSRVYEATAPGKMCAAIGVDFFKALTRREQREGKQAADYVIVQAATPDEARKAIREACAERAGQCRFGKFVYCNYRAPAPHDTKF